MKGVEVEVDQRRDLTAVLGPMSRGAGDPSLRRMPDGSMWLVGTFDDEPFSAHIVASNHAVRGAIDEAIRCREEGKSETILFNLCGHGHFDMQAYMDYFGGKLQDLDYDEADLAMALAGLPTEAAA